MLQLNPPIPVITPKGPALAHVLLDYGPEYDLIWVTFQDDSGECWAWNNKEIRAQKNITLGRTTVSMPVAMNETAKPRPRSIPNV